MTDIEKCVRKTSAPDWFKEAMAKGQVPIFGKKKSTSKVLRKNNTKR
jgi:hypothetical protein